MARTSFPSINEYIEAHPRNVQVLLGKIRKTIRDVAPEAEEIISYQMPVFRLYRRVLIYFAAWKQHVSMYPVPGGGTQFTKELSRYRTGKGTVRFSIEKPLPLKFIRTMIKNREKEILERLSRRKK